MKIQLFVCVVFLSIAAGSVTAQLKLKPLDNVILSMKEGETIDNYTTYVKGYFSRLAVLENLSETKNFKLTTNSDGSKSYLQGQGLNEQNQIVVFRTQVVVSKDGRVISKAKSKIDSELCISSDCTECSFSEIDCICQSKGSCKHSINSKSD